ncbi:MAG TPA: histidine kinase dimerization/phospho-acceptor domain-containing protein [Kofleriaceae bacterium]|jgi:signal transduction histidine kinase
MRAASRDAVFLLAIDALFDLYATQAVVVMVAATEDVPAFALARVRGRSLSRCEVPPELLSLPAPEMTKILGQCHRSRPLREWLDALTDDTEGILRDHPTYERADAVLACTSGCIVFRAARTTAGPAINAGLPTEVDVPFLDVVATHVATSVERATLSAEMEERVRERTLALAALGKLAAAVAHEINNPLTFILHNHSFLLDVLTDVMKGDTQDPELLQEVCQTARDNVAGVMRIRDIVQDLQLIADAPATRSMPTSGRHLKLVGS